MNKYFRVENHADALVVHVLDPRVYMDIAIASVELYAVADRPDCLKLVLNFSDVEFLSGGAARMLITVQNKIAEKNGVLRLCAVPKTIREVFKIVHLDRILDTRETEADAVGP